jgi:uncharacterized membrane protein HdeD (DUF308 family)
MGWKDLGLVVWTNLSHFLTGIAALIFPLATDSPVWCIVLRAVGVAAIVGLVRCRRNQALWPYLTYGIVASLVQILWASPPDLRYLYALAPLFAIGFLREGEHLIGLIRATARSARKSERVAAWGIGLAFASALAVGLWMQIYMDFGVLRQSIAGDRADRQERLAVYGWISRNSAEKEGVLAQNPAIFLYTGRQTGAVMGPPVYWYRGDIDRWNAGFQSLGSYATDLGFRWVCMSRADLPEGAFRKRTPREQGLVEVFRAGETTVYRVAMNR